VRSKEKYSRNLHHSFERKP